VILNKLTCFISYIREFLIQVFRCAKSYRQASYSQEGEDLVLSRLFGEREQGFYVDIGAHHPKKFSNTYFFYRKGWVGINVDAMPGSMSAFNLLRPRDINIERAISQNCCSMTYYMFNQPALNGFSKRLSDARSGNGKNYLLKTIDIETCRLSMILDEYLPSGQGIDFMSIDVEGLDLEVLKSNDWEKYRPRYVLIEVIGGDLPSLNTTEEHQYMLLNDYFLCAKLVNTIIYRCGLS